ncbi:MAG: hypothetical protein ABL879_11030 [Devosia sp.]
MLAMSWLLLLLLPLIGVPVLRLVLAFTMPARQAAPFPWTAVLIGLVVLAFLVFGTGRETPAPATDPADKYAEGDSALRALLE